MKFKNRLRTSVAKKFVLYILLFSSFAALISTSIQLFVEYKRDISAIEKTAIQIENSHKSTIAQALWAYDVVIMESQLQGIKNLPGVLYGCIKKDDEILKEIGSRHPDLRIQSYKYPLSHVVKNKQVRLGDLEVEVNLTEVYQRLWNRIFIIFLTQISKAVFVSIFIFFLFYLLVGRHLQSMANFVESINFDNLDEELSLNRKSAHQDELSLVEKAFNNMRRRLANEIEKVNISQKALEKSEKRFQFAMDSARDGLYDWNLIANEIYFSPSWKRMLGYEDGELPNDLAVWEQLTDPEDVKRAWKMQNELINHKRDRFEMEFKMKHKEGHWVDILSRATAVFDEKGTAERIIGTHVDITERKQAEISTMKSAKKYRTILQTAIDGFWIADDKGNLLEVNLAYSQMSGYSIDELLEMSIHQLDGSETFEEVGEHLEIGVKRGFDQFESVHRKKDGSLYGVELNFRYLTEEKVFVVFIKDISEQKEMQKRILQAQKMESIGTLAGGIAHDFNNILSSILGFSDLALQQVEKGSPIEDDLNEIYSAGSRAKDLVRQILTFARKSEDITKPVHVDVIAKEALKLIRSSIPTTIEIVSDIKSRRQVIGNQTQIHQIFMNLFTNAAHAMDKKGGTLRVNLIDVEIQKTLRWAEELIYPGNYLKIEISDTGVGIPDDIIMSIFEPYFTTKDKDKGTGMGLAVVHGIVTNYKGKIFVESQIGKGTKFSIYFPSIEEKNTNESHTVKELPGGVERILFVDDEHQIVNMNSRLLKRLGYEVDATTSSVDALELFKESPDSYDLILSDMTMPKITGDNLAEQMLKIKPNTKIILCTGYSQQVNEERIKKLNIKALLIKPVDSYKMATTIRKIIDD